MDKKHFVIYLIPSRPDFAQTMTDEERNIMLQHVAYWKTYLDQGVMLVFGPVFDPKGGYGLGIVAVDDEKQLLDLIEKDPASRINKYEHYPMRAVTKL
jgi:uncharacterized protein YciI